MLSWRREDNVYRIIDSWQRSGIISTAFVWNNNPDERLQHSWATIINANRDCGLYTRFAAACLAPTAGVLIQDDDILLEPPSQRMLLEHWANDPDVLHGIFGRRPKADGTYARIVDNIEAEVPIVLTRALITQRRYVADFFLKSAAFSALQTESNPPGNGEDIIFSYVTRSISGRLNRIHHIPFAELPAPQAIHHRLGDAHLEHRTHIMRACENFLAVPSCITPV